MMTVYNNTSLNRLQTLFRNFTEHIRVASIKWEARSVSRKCFDTVNASSNAKSTISIFRKIKDSLKGIDCHSFSVLFVRSVSDTALPSDKMRHWGSFIRSLLVSAGSKAETSHKANYYRFRKDKVEAQGLVFRGLFMFVRIITKVFVRDYFLGRFLKARQDLILKSPVCREIIHESKLS